MPQSKLANTPLSARVKRPSDRDQPASFFDELPEFKRLKSSERCEGASSSKFGDFATPGYKNGQMFERYSETAGKGKSEENMFDFLAVF